MHLTKAQRLLVIIGISSSFFLAEIAVGFYTRSLAVISDAFHYLNDLIGFVVALLALKISRRTDSPDHLSFGWQRANLLGAFFNGVFLLALGVSIFLQSVERFVAIQQVENPEVVLIIGCVGFALNVISAIFLHDHDHDVETAVEGGGQPTETALQNLQDSGTHSDHRHETRPDRKNKSGRDLGMAGVLLHVLGDAANNVGVIIAAVIIWKVDSEARYYADPAVSMLIALMILLSSLPLVRKTGIILMESAPSGVNLYDVMHDLQKLPGVMSVHELHIWRLNQEKSIASAHIMTRPESTMSEFMALAKTINECFHAYGIHSATLQPELGAISDLSLGGQSTAIGEQDGTEERSVRYRRAENSSCRIGCRMTSCEELTCCG